MGAGVFHGRVRDGNGCGNPAMATGPPGRIPSVYLELVVCESACRAAWCCVWCPAFRLGDAVVWI